MVKIYKSLLLMIYNLHSILQLMELCTQKFKLESHCTAIYDWRGEQITDLSSGIYDLIHNMTIDICQRN